MRAGDDKTPFLVTFYPFSAYFFRLPELSEGIVVRNTLRIENWQRCGLRIPLISFR